ncbi:MAG: hypothetical protein ACLGI7_11025 [Gammaproteobacteria bacterium]
MDVVIQDGPPLAIGARADRDSSRNHHASQRQPRGPETDALIHQRHSFDQSFGTVAGRRRALREPRWCAPAPKRARLRSAGSPL